MILFSVAHMYILHSVSAGLTLISSWNFQFHPRYETFGYFVFVKLNEILERGNWRYSSRENCLPSMHKVKVQFSSPKINGEEKC